MEAGKEVAEKKKATEDKRKKRKHEESFSGNEAKKPTKEEEVAMVKKRIEELEANNPELRHPFEYDPCCIAEGNIKWLLKAERIGEEEIFSRVRNLCGLSFTLGCKLSGRIAHRLSIEICLYCMDKSKAAQAFLARVDSRLHCVGEAETFSGLSTISRLDAQCEYRIVYAFTKSGYVTVDAQIKLVAYCKNDCADLARLAYSPPDVTLIVGDNSFRANKKYLAHFSDHFKTVFFDVSKEDSDTFTADGIDADEFDVFLSVLVRPQCGLPKKVTAANVTVLLKMADFFSVDALFCWCTKFLMNSTDFSLTAKLQIGDKFGLHEVLHSLLADMKNTRDLFNCISSPEFGELSEKLQMHILKEYIKHSAE